MKANVIVSAFLALSVSTPTFAKEPIEATAVTQWEVDFAPESCGIKRHFQLGEGIVSFELRQFTPHDGFDLTVFTNTLKRTGASPEIRFGEHDDTIRHDSFFKLLSGEWSGIKLMLPGNYFGDGAQKRRVLSISKSFEQDMALPLDSLDLAHKALTDCMDDLVASWGLDPAGQRTLSKPVAVPELPWGWMSDALRATHSERRKAREDQVRILLIVGSNGRASSCKMLGAISTSKSAIKACDGIMRQAEFEPALDATGKPVRSFFLATGAAYVTRSTVSF
ncbi:hypothetical protein [Altererythrobacter sp. Z27]|uniref:hypothetical protein n=1 Tax=Altererythrobacter sp. Z27 TaxID=3461147 RepID=UPI0040440E59